MSALLHRSGGTITAVRAIGHDTYRRVSDWFFIGRVEWHDGSVSESVRITPTGLCHDDSEASQARVRDLMRQLSEYLEVAGSWHGMKHTSDGRCYSWTPHTPKGEVAVQS
jgi:hypothetical protein